MILVGNTIPFALFSEIEMKEFKLAGGTITESLRRCGISDSSSYILAARFNASPEEIKAIEDLVTGKEMSTPSYPEKSKIKAIEDLVTGKEMNLDELEGRADKAKIQKVCAVLDFMVFVSPCLLR
ncbi:hypothetical protein EJ110_NYTH47950 [Nymphaea thermarum]|nr:hypothetical protein EJ110_NYTH47950 [Nymphaea thermarum]